MNIYDYGLSFYMRFSESSRYIFGRLSDPIIINCSDLVLFGIKYNDEVCAFLSPSIHKSDSDFTMAYYEKTGIRNVYDKRFKPIAFPSNYKSQKIDLRELFVNNLIFEMERTNFHMYDEIAPDIRKIANYYLDKT